jgi:hypothetical protein
LSNKRQSHDLKLLRRYLGQAQVPTLFCVAIENTVMNEATHARVLEDDVKLLKSLPPKMAHVLREMVFGRAVHSQTFIRVCQGVCDNFIHVLCSIALESRVVQPGLVGDFEHGKEAVGPHMVFWGSFQYHRKGPSAHGELMSLADLSRSRPLVAQKTLSASSLRSRSVPTTKRVEVQDCQWLTEMAIFCHFYHVGSLHAVSEGELLTIRGERLTSIMNDHSDMYDLFVEYGSFLLEKIREDPNRADDLRLPLSHENVVTLLSQESKKLLSKAGLKSLLRSNKFNPNGSRLKALSAEVANGDCFLVVEATLPSWRDSCLEEVHRIVSIAVLSIKHEDGSGRLLVQIGHFKGDHIVPEVLLPGSKVHAHEVPSEAKHRLIDGHFSKLQEFITWNRDEVLVHEKSSWRFNVSTKYVKRMYYGTLQEAGHSAFTALEWHHKGGLANASAKHLTKVFTNHHLAHTFVLDSTLQEDARIYCWMDPEDIERPQILESVQDFFNSHVPSVSSPGDGDEGSHLGPR